MKKILLFGMLAISGAAHAANSDWGNVIAHDFGSPYYLVGAANAWSGLIGSPWRGGRIATQMNDLHTARNDARMYEVLSTLAYNHTTMTIVQANQYMQYAFYAIDGAPVAQRVGRVPKFNLTARAIGAYSDYDGSKNNNFKFRTGGAGVQASAAVTGGFVFGVGYNYADSRSKHTALNMKATTNIVSMFSKYTTQGGLYINSTIAGGRIQWDADKRAVGVKDDTTFNTDVWGGAINTGVVIERGRFFIRPQIGAKYVRLSTEHFTDAAAQSFKKWWYNTLNTGGDVNIGIAFNTDTLTIVPHMTMGAGYDVLRHGSDHIHVGVITGQYYDMPVVGPGRMHLRGGLGATISAGAYRAGLEYKLDAMSDYISHGVMATLKISF